MFSRHVWSGWALVVGVCVVQSESDDDDDFDEAVSDEDDSDEDASVYVCFSPAALEILPNALCVSGFCLSSYSSFCTFACRDDDDDSEERGLTWEEMEAKAREDDKKRAREEEDSDDSDDRRGKVLALCPAVPLWLFLFGRLALAW